MSDNFMQQIEQQLEETDLSEKQLAAYWMQKFQELANHMIGKTVETVVDVQEIDNYSAEGEISMESGDSYAYKLMIEQGVSLDRET